MATGGVYEAIRWWVAEFSMIAGALALAALAFSHPIPATAPPSLEEVRASLASSGPQATVRRLSEHGRFGYVLNRIGTGERAWTGLASRLAKGVDGANAEGLTIALAEALPKNPRIVIAALDLGGGILSPDKVCGAPFIEPKPGVVARHKERALRAVAAVRSASMAKATDACLAALRAIPG